MLEQGGRRGAGLGQGPNDPTCQDGEGNNEEHKKVWRDKCEGHTVEQAKDRQTDDQKPVTIARYLAAAGLDLTQANALLQKVRAEQSEALLEGRRRNHGIGIGLIFAGMLAFVCQALMHTGYRFASIVSMGLFFMGVAMTYLSAQPIPKSLLHEPLEPAEPDKPQ